MTKGILGKKLGMSQMFTEDGTVIPLTVIQAGPCRVLQVKVKDVNTLVVKGKWRRRGRSFGKTQDWKRAMVVLEEGQTIDVL